jgi:hypothetical protein
MHKVVLTLALVAVCSSGALAANTDMGKFIGLWEVDSDRTMDEVKKSPEYNARTAERMPKRIKSSMKIQITDRQLIYLVRDKKMAVDYSVVSSTTNTVTISVKHGANEAKSVFSLIDGDFMNVKPLTGSDDMTYFVWRRRAESEKTSGKKTLE